jgi:hypothetical protein
MYIFYPNKKKKKNVVSFPSTRLKLNSTQRLLKTFILTLHALLRSNNNNNGKNEKSFYLYVKEKRVRYNIHSVPKRTQDLSLL